MGNGRGMDGRLARWDLGLSIKLTLWVNLTKFEVCESVSFRKALKLNIDLTARPTD